MSALGRNILRQQFEHHEAVQVEILDQIFARVAVAATSVESWVLLLADILQNSLYQILQQINKIKEAMEFISLLPPNVARLLLQAVQPLLPHSPSFREYVLVILKKSLFSGAAENRITAAHSILQLISGDKNPDPNLARELLGLLHRCLQQQAAVRQAFYQGIPGVLASNFNLSQPIFEILLTQMELYCKTKHGCPLQTSKMSQRVALGIELLEPFPDLLASVVECLHNYRKIQAREQLESLSIADQLQALVFGFAQSMRDAELEVYKIDKATEFTTATVEGLQNILLCSTLQGTYEILIESILAELTEDNVDMAMALFGHCWKCMTILKKVKPNSKSGLTITQLPPRVMSRRRLMALEVALTQDLPACAKLQKDLNFRKLLLDRIGHHVAAIARATPPSEKETLWCADIASKLLHQFTDKFNEDKDQKPEGSNQTITFSTLECVRHCVQAIFDNSRIDVTRAAFLLNRIVGSAGDVDPSATLASHISDFEENVEILGFQENKWAEAEVACSLAAQLCDFLPANLLEDRFAWANARCQQQVENTGLVKVLLAHGLRLNWRVGNEIVPELIVELKNVNGAIDEPPKGDPVTYLCVNKKTWSTVIAALFAFLEDVLRELEQGLQLLRSATADLAKSTGFLKALEETLILVEQLVTVNPYLDKGDTVTSKQNSVLRKLYRIIQQTAKQYFYVVKNCPQKLRDIIRFTGIQLSSAIKKFVNAIEKNPNGAKSSRASKDARELPQLIYCVEAFDVLVRKFEKKVPAARDLTRGFVRSLGRDVKWTGAMRPPPEPEKGGPAKKQKRKRLGEINKQE